MASKWWFYPSCSNVRSVVGYKICVCVGRENNFTLFAKQCLEYIVCNLFQQQTTMCISETGLSDFWWVHTPAQKASVDWNSVKEAKFMEDWHPKMLSFQCFTEYWEHITLHEHSKIDPYTQWTKNGLKKVVQWLILIKVTHFVLE